MLLAVQVEQVLLLVGFATCTAIHVALLIGDCVNCQSHRALYIYILPSPQGGMAYTALAAPLNSHANGLQTCIHVHVIYIQLYIPSTFCCLDRFKRRSCSPSFNVLASFTICLQGFCKQIFHLMKCFQLIIFMYLTCTCALVLEYVLEYGSGEGALTFNVGLTVLC